MITPSIALACLSERMAGIGDQDQRKPRETEPAAPAAHGLTNQPTAWVRASIR